MRGLYRRFFAGPLDGETREVPLDLTVLKVPLLEPQSAVPLDVATVPPACRVGTYWLGSDGRMRWQEPLK